MKDVGKMLAKGSKTSKVVREEIRNRKAENLEKEAWIWPLKT
jgi:hypothetical protein